LSCPPIHPLYSSSPITALCLLLSFLRWTQRTANSIKNPCLKTGSVTLETFNVSLESCNDPSDTSLVGKHTRTFVNKCTTPTNTLKLVTTADTFLCILVSPYVYVLRYVRSSLFFFPKLTLCVHSIENLTNTHSLHWSTSSVHFKIQHLYHSAPAPDSYPALSCTCASDPYSQAWWFLRAPRRGTDMYIANKIDIITKNN